jgi:hypothetical protein
VAQLSTLGIIARMKPSTRKWLLIIAVVWAAMPWLCWFVFQFHKPDHADVFWLPAMPLVIISFIPMLVSHPDTVGFPVGWVIGSSVFNFMVVALVMFFVKSIQETK